MAPDDDDTLTRGTRRRPSARWDLPPAMWMLAVLAGLASDVVWSIHATVADLGAVGRDPLVVRTDATWDGRGLPLPAIADEGTGIESLPPGRVLERVMGTVSGRHQLSFTRDFADPPASTVIAAERLGATTLHPHGEWVTWCGASVSADAEDSGRGSEAGGSPFRELGLSHRL